MSNENKELSPLGQVMQQVHKEAEERAGKEISAKSRKFIFQIVSQNKQSTYIHSNQASESKWSDYHVYGTYETNWLAIQELYDIYDKRQLGTQYDTEYFIVKKEVKTERLV